MRVADPEQGVEQMRAGDADMALIIEVPDAGEPEFDGVATATIIDDPMFLLLPAGHRLEGRRRVHMGELADEHWVMGSSTGMCPDARIFRGACRAAGFEPRVVFQTEDYPAIQGLVASGMGISLLPQMAAQSIHPDVVIRPLGPTAPRRRIAAAFLSDSWRSPAKRAMLDALVAAAADTAGDHAGPADVRDLRAGSPPG